MNIAQPGLAVWTGGIWILLLLYAPSMGEDNQSAVNPCCSRSTNDQAVDQMMGLDSSSPCWWFIFYFFFILFAALVLGKGHLPISSFQKKIQN